MSLLSASSAANSAATTALEAYQKSLSATVEAARANGTSFAAVVSELAAQMAQKSTSTMASTPDASSTAVANPPASMAKSTASAVANPIQNNAFFYGYNGKAYSLAPPTGDSFLGSNGQTYTRQQINNFYAKHPKPGDDIAEMARLGLKFPDLYKARALAGQGNGTGIYTDPKEMTQYHDYLQSAMPQTGGVGAALSFDQWRNMQEPSYLASLQTGPIDNVGWINGPVGGVAVGGANAASRTSTFALAGLTTNGQA